MIYDFQSLNVVRVRFKAWKIKERKLIGRKNARPHPVLLPRKKEQQPLVSGVMDNRPAKPVARIFKVAANYSPSPWREGWVEGGQNPNCDAMADLHTNPE